MTIVDRYLLRLYVKVLVVCLLCLFGLFVVIDAFGNLDEFLAYGKRHSAGVFGVLLDYYWPRLLWFFDRTGAMLAMVSVAFVLTLIQRSNELTAIVAAGISPARVARPLLVASLIVAILGIVNREFGLPLVRESLAKNAQDWLGEESRKCTPRYDLRTDILISGKSTYSKDRRIAAPLFRMPPELSQWGPQILADNAYYQPESAGRPAGYLLRGVRQPLDLVQRKSVSPHGLPVLYSPADTPWLKPDECFVASVVTFEQLSVGGSWRQYLSSLELIAGIRGQTIEPGADVRLMIHARVVQPLLDLSLVLLGIPLVLSRGNRNIFLAAGIGGLLVGAMMILVLVCHAIGSNYLLDATLAAWLPLLIFGPVAYASARPLWD
ncbi:MAG TPA: LptF/LptG family permease [Pirellulaceae bacterium]|nr:LptF/LptG family permease [Pirellulaceae bacterium]